MNPTNTSILGKRIKITKTDRSTALYLGLSGIVTHDPAWYRGMKFGAYVIVELDRIGPQSQLSVIIRRDYVIVVDPTGVE